VSGDRIDRLVAEYRDQLRLPWSRTLAGPQRVWMVVYDPELERRLRLKLEDFASETRDAGHAWELIDLTSSFADWLAANEYREAYFAEPELLAGALGGYAETIAQRVESALADPKLGGDSVVAILGAGSLFPMARMSELLDRVSPSIRGRLVVFFPGHVDGSNYRLLDARDGWNYLAVPITIGG
jgi:hypothetical protein